MLLRNGIYIIYIIFLYLYIYSPYLRVINTGTSKILLFSALLFFLFRFKYLRYFKLFLVEILLLAIVIVYSSIIVIFGDGTAYNIPYFHIQFIADCFLIPIFIFSLFKKKIDFNNINDQLIKVGVLASIITVFLVLNPLFNYYLRENIIVDDLDSGDTVQDSLRFIRGFTFSDSSTFGYGITQGLVFGLALNETKKNNRYFLVLPLLLFSIFFNARIGFVMAIIAIFLLYKRFKLISFFYILIPVFITVFFLKNSEFVETNSKSIEWATDFFIESFNFMSSNQNTETTYDTLTGDMLFFPENIYGLIFGEGKIVMGRRIGSDVGYVNQIFIGGLVYLLLLFLILLFFYFNLLKISNKSFVALLFLLTILIINFKGSALFTSHSFFRFFMLLYVVHKCMNFEKQTIARFTI